MNAGCARVSITPATGLYFGGKTHADPIRISHICSDIFARAVVFQAAKIKLALVNVELCYFHAHWVSKVRALVAAQTDIPATNICIAATHNHSGPDTFLYFDRDYVEGIIPKIAKAVCEADLGLKPVRLVAGSMPILGPATNRRIKMKDGSIRMRAIGFVPPPSEQVAGPGPVDRELRLLRIESSADAKPIAFLCNYACHASVALESTCVSGDFPGYAAQFVERETGAYLLFTAGASANINPVAFCHNRSDVEARRIGKEFGMGVLALANKLPVASGQSSVDRSSGSDNSMSIISKRIAFPIRKEFFGSRRHDADGRPQPPSKGITPPAQPMELPDGSEARFYPSSIEVEVEKIRRMEQASILPPVLATGRISSEISRITLGNLTLLTLPGELFVEIGLAILAPTPSPCWIMSHANDAIGYIPTAEAFAEGGYESAPFALSLLTPEAESIVRNAALELLSRK